MHMPVVTDEKLIDTQGFVDFDDSPLDILRHHPSWGKKYLRLKYWWFSVRGVLGGRGLLEIPYIHHATWGYAPETGDYHIIFLWKLFRGLEPPPVILNGERDSIFSKSILVIDRVKFGRDRRDSIEYKIWSYQRTYNAGNVHRFLVDLSDLGGGDRVAYMNLALYIYGDYEDIRGGICYVPGPSSLSHREAV